MAGICSEPNTVVYTDGTFGIGSFLYTDINLTIPLTGYSFFEINSTKIVYNIDPLTGEVLSETGIICGSGITGAYKLGNDIGTICEEDDTVLYTSGEFGIGKTLYEDINLTTILSTPYSFIVDSSTGYIYTMYNSVVTGLTTGICGGDIAGEYRVSNIATEVCLQGTIFTLYTPAPFAVGVFLFTDENLLTPFTGYIYIVNPANNYIYILNPATGEILSQTIYGCTADLYIPDIDAFQVEVTRLLNTNNCDDCDTFNDIP